MAEIEFWGSIRDWGLLLDTLFSRASVCGVLDIWYDSKRVETFDAASEEIMTRLRRKPRLFLVPTILREQASLGLVQQQLGREMGRYRLEVERLLSGLELVLPACFEEGGRIKLNSGSLACPREVFNHRNSRWERPENSRRELY